MANSLFSQLAGDLLGISNDLLGIPCSYIRKADNVQFDDCMIIIDQNVKVFDEFKTLIGYRIEACIKRIDVPQQPQPGDRIIAGGGISYTCGDCSRITHHKWYVDLRG